MCGIYGIVSLVGEPLRRPELLEQMGRALSHRGPDGHAIEGPRHARLGTERLRIIDLHERADQPFTDPDKTCVLACNGEIYNCAELRRQASDYPFRSQSDVETILPLYLARGVAGLSELDGMFGLAIWDDRRQRLILGRDRAGEKPLFYVRLGQEIYFASEVQALLLLPGLSRAGDPQAVEQFLNLGYVLEPRTLFAAIRRIPAGTFVSFDRDGEHAEAYWDPTQLAASSDSSTERADPALERLQALFERAVAKQVQSDVPIGVFTSGGLDSSLLAAHTARELGPGRVHTYAARFSVDAFDESPWAARLAAHLGTVHHEVNCDEGTLADTFEAVLGRMAEPLADPAVLPTYLLAQAARRDVTVILSGEGADELFGGYPTYLGHQLAPALAALPAVARRALLALVSLWPSSRGNLPLAFLLQRFLADVGKPVLERHLSWFATGFTALDSSRPWLQALFKSPGPRGDLAAAMSLDYRTYLRDDLLVKVDRATMMHSVEARAPFLDRDITAFALGLPSRLKVRGLTTKWLLKRYAAKVLPVEIVGRRKRGLSVPIARMINGGMRAEVDRLLAPERLAERRLVDVERARRLLAEHRAGHANHARKLWALIVFEAWTERWMPDLTIDRGASAW